MWEPYRKTVREQLPDGELKIVFDKFHVLQLVLQRIIAAGGGSDSPSPKATGPLRTGPGATWTVVTAPSETSNWRGVAVTTIPYV